MDEENIVSKLTRNENNRELNLESELTLKEIQKLDFKPKPYENVILSDRYTIQGSKILYLYNIDNDPYPEGVFEAEDLIKEDKSSDEVHYIDGPTRISGSNRFFDVFRTTKFKSFLRIFQLPDKTQKTLINDFQNFVDMSTFLQNGNILVKIRRRFMLFTADGGFIEEISFDDSALEEIEALESGREVPIEVIKYKEGKHESKPIPASRIAKEPIFDFQGNPWKFKEKEKPPPLAESNKMELLQMSYDNKYFLFYNRMLDKILVYELKEVERSVEQMLDLSQTGNANPSPTCYKFVLYYDIQIEYSQLATHLYSIDIDPIKYYRENMGQLRISGGAVVRMCYCENLPYIERGPDDIEGWTGPFKPQIQCRYLGLVVRKKEG